MERAVLLVGLVVIMALPASAKTRRTFYDDALMASVKQKVAEDPSARSQAEAAKRECQWLLDMSDQELWDFLPPPEQMRAINVHIAHDCPVCGDEVNRRAGHYPWITSRDKPFKVECPVCHGVFPKNDFQPWNTEGLAGKPAEGAEPTDYGLGWLDPKDGRRYYFVPYYIFWQRWSRDILGGLRSLGNAYLLTGDPALAHKAGIILAKIGSEYERFDYPKQVYHEGRFGVGGRIMDYIWSTGNDSTIALAYDAVYPGVAPDRELAQFLQTKGLGQPNAIIEKMLWVMVKDVMDGRVAGNMGMHQLTLCHLAIVMDNSDPQAGPTTKDMADWIMRGPGRTEDLLWNGFYREGLGAESSPGYSSSWCSNFYRIADLLPRLGLDIWSNPKLRKMADIGSDLTVAGQFSPSIGDSGRLTGTGPIALTAEIQGRAFTRYHDPKYARMLKDMGASPGGLFERYFDPAEMEKAAATAPPLELRTRNLGGYGCAILESGATGHKRGLSLYYGDAGGGHGHFDRLNVELFSHGQAVMPEDGYPTPFTRPDFHEWRRANTYRHFCVMVDELPQLSYEAGDLNALIGAPEVQLVDASAEAAYSGRASLYRRTAALIDISPEESYLLDVWRVKGGAQHDWCSHAGAPEMTVTGGTLGPVQAKGTLAGENVAYGKKPGPRAGADDVAFDLASGEGVKTGPKYQEVAETSWTPHVKGILTRRVGSELTLKLPAPIPAGKYKLFLQYWDHDAGASELELALGATVIPVKIQTAAGKDYKWQGQVVELAAPAETLRLKVLSSERSYVMINHMVLSRRLDRDQPAVPEGVSSGFQGLFNVQRMKPAGGWGSTWTHWTEKSLQVTTTMPAGCAQEVIVADGEPEAQTGNPRTIKYALARNTGDGAQPLLSKFVSTIEAHVGPAQITEVKLLQAAPAAREAVGVQVVRGAAMDFISSALNGEESAAWKGAAQPFAAQAEFALVTVDAQGVQRALLVNGRSLRYGDFALQVEPPPAGQIVSADPKTNSIVIDAALPAPEAFVDRVITFANDLQRTSYTIKSAQVKGGQTVLGFGDVLFIIGMAMASKFDEAAATVTTVDPLAGYGKIEGGRHAGRWLLSEDRSRGLKILSAAGNQFKLEQPDKPLAETYIDADGDGRRQLWISDLGPGDTYRIPAMTWVQRAAPGVYKVQTLTKAEVSVAGK
jgi:hypothetical protein